MATLGCLAQPAGTLRYPHVPLNGKGDVKGNTTIVDGIFKDADGNYFIDEYKYSRNSPLTKGQKIAKEHVESGDAQFYSPTGISKLGIEKNKLFKVEKYEVFYRE